VNDIVFRNYTRMFTRSKKLYFRGFPFPVPIIESAIAVGTIYIYWKMIMPIIPSWIPLLGTNTLIQMLLGFALATGGFLLIKIRTTDNRPVLYTVIGFTKTKLGTKVYNTRTGKTVARKPVTIAERDISYG
jgi:hypothetical protein